MHNLCRDFRTLYGRKLRVKVECYCTNLNSCRVCWLTIRKRTVFKSARNYLPMQKLMKTFLRTSKQEMRRGFMGVMLKPRCNRRSGWGKDLLDQKDTDESFKDQGVVGCVFDWKGIVHHEFVPRGQMVNKQFYQEVLACWRNAVRRKRPELWENQTLMLHHDNAPAHASLLIRIFLSKIRHPLCPIHPILRT